MQILTNYLSFHGKWYTISYRFIGNLRVNVLGGYLDSMEQDKTFLGTEPIGKLLMKLAVPTVIAQLVNMLYNII